MNVDECEIGDDLLIAKNERREGVGGSWVRGRLNGHRFDALVFPEHADCPEYEIGGNGPDGSKISKLWIQRIADKTQVFNWDRGEDMPAADATTQAIVDFLCAGLSEHIFAE